MEQQLPYWYPELTRVTGQKDHDHIDNTGRLFDQKTFTARGVNCQPSNQIGKGRHFVEGKELIKDYPELKVKFTQREEFLWPNQTNGQV